MEKKKIYFNGKEWRRCVLILCLAGCLMVSGGCGRKEGAADKETQAIREKTYMDGQRSETQKETEAKAGAEIKDSPGGEIEGNSLAEWEKNLPEGRTEKMSAAAIRGICVRKEGEP